MKKKLLAMILAALLTLALGSTVAFAAAGPVNPVPEDQECSITVRLINPANNRPITNCPVYIWKIAEVEGSDANLHYTPTAKFEEFFETYFSENLEDLNETNLRVGKTSWDRFAEALYTDPTLLPAFIDQNGILADEALRTADDSNTTERIGTEAGTVTFTTNRDGTPLTPGLYLMRINEFPANGYQNGYRFRFQTSFFLLPGGYIDASGNVVDDWTWDYSVDVMPKIEYEEEPSIPTPPPPPPPPPEPPTPPEEPPTPPEEPPTPPEEPPTPPEEPPTPPEEPIPEEPVPLVYPPEEEIPEEPTPRTPPEEPEEEIPDEEIPLTGQLWWPVPAMGAGGVVCVSIGSLLSKKKDDEDDQ